MTVEEQIRALLDEAQFITDPLRGITVELLLTYLLAARERDIKPQLIALSAVIGDINDFDGWLSRYRSRGQADVGGLVDDVLRGLSGRRRG